MTLRYPTIFRNVLLPAAAVAVLCCAQPAAAQTALFNYSVKFVCGVQRPHLPPEPGEPPVKPGNYATEININNIQFSQINVFKSIVLVVDHGEPVGREPNAQPPRPFVAVPMGSRFAMMDDCNQLWAMAFPGGVAPPNPMPLMVGYLSIVSLVDIDVDAVYTTLAFPTATGDLALTPSIDVERVLAKRVTVSATSAVASALRSKE